MITDWFRPPINASLSPNTDSRDVRAAWSLLFRPRVWKKGPALAKAERWFCDEFDVESTAFFKSGRAALLALLEALSIGKGDDVMVQAFSCVAVVNSVRWAGATPVYVDIDGSLNLDPEDLEKKITKRTKAVIVQHTFGIPADMKRIMAVARKHNLLVIEDCAHALGASYDGKKLGEWGDAAFFSFGRDKAVSSVWGGATFIRNDHSAVHRLIKLQKHLPDPGYFWIFQQLLHPVAFFVILPLYTLGVGKAILVLLQMLHLLSKPVASEEYVGRKPDDTMTAYPDALAALLLLQLHKLPLMVEQRKQSAAFYEKNLPEEVKRVMVRSGASYLRFPVFVDAPDGVRMRAKGRGILLGNWYHHVIDPGSVRFDSIGYHEGMCPHAEWASAHIINLPTLVDKQSVERVLSVM